jgi:hypothetical protein
MQDIGDLALGDGALTDFAQLRIDPCLLAVDAQRLVEIAAGLEDVGDLALGNGYGPDVAQPRVDWKRFLAADA